MFIYSKVARRLGSVLRNKTGWFLPPPDAGDPDPLLETGVTGDVAAPLEPAAAGHLLLLHLLPPLQPTGPAHVLTAPHLLVLVLRGRSNLEGPAEDAGVTQGREAVVGRRLEVYQVSPLHLVLLLPEVCPPFSGLRAGVCTATGG